MSKSDLWIKVDKKNKIKNKQKDDFVYEENYNKKKILCNSFLKNEECQYDSKCLYAHSYEEQKMDKIRKKAYDIIQNEFDLSYLDFTNNDENNYEILKNLQTLTKVCQECIKKNCAGGVNCKFGTYTPLLQVCSDDMMNGKCSNTECNKVHLTRRGFNYINKNDNKKKKKPNGIYVPKCVEINDDFFLSDNFKNLLNESEVNFDEISSVDTSLDESIFD